MSAMKRMLDTVIKANPEQAIMLEFGAAQPLSGLISVVGELYVAKAIAITQLGKKRLMTVYFDIGQVKWFSHDPSPINDHPDDRALLGLTPLPGAPGLSAADLKELGIE